MMCVWETPTLCDQVIIDTIPRQTNVLSFFPRLTWFQHELKIKSHTNKTQNWFHPFNFNCKYLIHVDFRVILPLSGFSPGRDPMQHCDFGGKNTHLLQVLLPKINHRVSNLILLQKYWILLRKNTVKNGGNKWNESHTLFILIHQPGWLWKRSSSYPKVPKNWGSKKTPPKKCLLK